MVKHSWMRRLLRGMIAVELLAYACSATVLVTYFIMVRKGVERPFHWANALGFPPVLATEIAVGAYPAMVLTVAFGILGWIGVLRGSGKSPDVDVSELVPAPLVTPDTKNATDELKAHLEKSPWVINWKANQ
jgi:hypothetical protein